MSANDKDDDAWLDALRGQPRPGTDPALLTQVQDLRDALQAQRSSDEASEPPLDDDPGLQRLLFRLRRERLLELSQATAARVGWRIPVAAVAVLVLGVVLVIGQAPTPEPDTLRGAGDVQVVTVQDVFATRERIEAQLRSSGATLSTVELGQGAVEIAATVPPSGLASVTLALATFGLRAPGADGSLRIELRPERKAP